MDPARGKIDKYTAEQSRNVHKALLLQILVGAVIYTLLGLSTLEQ